MALGAPWTAWSPVDRPALPKWHDGRALLVGDAAHAALPYLAQGAAMALEDAEALPRCLDSLASFAEHRLARTTAIAARSRALAKTYHAGGLRRMARNIVLRAIPTEQFMRQLADIYGYRG